jgi:hypothetical protein
MSKKVTDAVGESRAEFVGNKADGLLRQLRGDTKFATPVHSYTAAELKVLMKQYANEQDRDVDIGTIRLALSCFLVWLEKERGRR